MENINQEVAIVHKIGVGSSGVILGLMNFFIGLILAVILFVLVLLFGSSLSDYPEFSNMTLNYLYIVLIPFVLGILGFLSGIFFALFYNLSAKVGKGLRLYSY